MTDAEITLSVIAVNAAAILIVALLEYAISTRGNQAANHLTTRAESIRSTP